MNVYQQIDHDFLQRFPGGLQDPAWQALGQKHKSVNKVIALCQSELGRAQLDAAVAGAQYAAVSEACRKLVGLSTTVSTFEKLAFRNYLGFRDVHPAFVATLCGVLHDFGADSFADFVDALRLCRGDGVDPAKWPLVSCFLAYSDPQRHVCVKPTTIKKVAARLGVDIGYRPLPNYDTYCRVQAMVQDFRAHSRLAADQSNVIAQAIMYCVV